MKKILKIIPIVLLIIYAYLILLIPYYQNAKLYLLFLLIIAILNIINAHKNNNYSTLAKYNMIAKLLLIPIFCIIFFCWLGVLFFSSLTIAGIVYAPFFGIIFLSIDILLLISTSTYGINALKKAKKNQEIDIIFSTTHTILHLLFVLDIISSIIVFKKLKQKK